jgi:hypothetical protein
MEPVPVLPEQVEVVPVHKVSQMVLPLPLILAAAAAVVDTMAAAGL